MLRKSRYLLILFIIMYLLYRLCMLITINITICKPWHSLCLGWIPAHTCKKAKTELEKIAPYFKVNTEYWEQNCVFVGGRGVYCIWTRVWKDRCIFNLAFCLCSKIYIYSRYIKAKIWKKCFILQYDILVSWPVFFLDPVYSLDPA